jgi:hypothetical protein
MDKSYVIIGDQVFQQPVGIPVDTNYAPFIGRYKNKILAMCFKHTYRYIDDILSIHTLNFHSNVHLIYPDELEIKDTTESDISASYLDILLNIDVDD